MTSLDILLPFYGDTDLVQQAVRSVLRQTSPDWRLLVVDDARPGPSLQPWLAGLGDERVVYRRNPTNLGIAGNFARCLELASAAYVTFLGDDDLLLPDYVATVLTAARDTGAALVQPGVRVVDQQGTEVHPLADRVKDLLRPRVTATTLLSGERLATSLVRGNWAYFPSLCWRRETAARYGFTPDLEVALDLRLILELVLADEALVLVPDVCFSYRRHAGSASATAARSVVRFEEEDAVLDWAAARCDDRGWRTAGRAARRRVSSRLHALSLLPGAVSDADARQRLLQHAFRRT